MQRDVNLSSTEILLRHFVHAQEYFVSRFGRPVWVAWAAVSFEHSGGLPEILAAAGVTAFVLTRPFPSAVPLPKPAFWWEKPGGSRIPAYGTPLGWYGTEGEEIPEPLDRALEEASA